MDQNTPSTNKKPAHFGLWLLVLGLFVVAGLLIARDAHIMKQAALENPVGRPAPDAPVTTLGGDPARLSSLRGHPVWLNFFATWCPPCKAEMPQIEQRYQRLHNDHLEVVGLDQQETPKLIQPFVNRLGVTFPVLIDEGPAAAAYSVFALPTSVFIDSQGVVRAVKTGEMSPAEMDADLKLIDGQS
jgi:peroxiredoxin